MHNEVKEFPAGHFFYNNKFSEYWNNDYSEAIPSDEELFHLIKSAVEYRNIADVSIGSYLSGGLDSTIITAVAEIEHNGLLALSNLMNSNGLELQLISSVRNTIRF